MSLPTRCSRAGSVTLCFSEEAIAVRYSDPGSSTGPAADCRFRQEVDFDAMNDAASPRNAYPAFWGPFALIGEGAAR